MLEDKSHATLTRRRVAHVFTMKQHFARPIIRKLKTRYDAQQRGFA
jgi:hypothetical protein